MPLRRDEDIRAVFDLTSIAVVGCSATPGKPAHDVPRYLRDRGYEVIPVNPHADEVLGVEAYDSLSEVEEDVDVVNVFRPSDELAGIVDEVLERDDVKVLWTQRGVRDRGATDRAEEAGVEVVEDRCMRTEHRRLVG